jgi:pimeloyl-ACP methyl ester carboxylesterase
VSRFKTPTLILWGEWDQAFPAANQARLRIALPRALFKEYPRVGHDLHWETPTAVAADMLAFLE